MASKPQPVGWLPTRQRLKGEGKYWSFQGTHSEHCHKGSQLKAWQKIVLFFLKVTLEQ